MDTNKTDPVHNYVLASLYVSEPTIIIIYTYSSKISLTLIDFPHFETLFGV